MPVAKSYTTHEAARRLGCHASQALSILKASDIAHTRCGAAYLWDSESVDALRGFLRGGVLAEARSTHG